jgi:hypothetical protein
MSLSFYLGELIFWENNFEFCELWLEGKQGGDCCDNDGDSEFDGGLVYDSVFVVPFVAVLLIVIVVVLLIVIVVALLIVV